MKILVIGLDCAAPEILLGDERLTNIRRLMELGCYGLLESVIPPITVPAWMCMATSQDPGSLGVYGFRNRSDHSYSGLQIVNSRSIRELTMWDQVGREGGRSVIVGVPPSFPPRKINGISIGCFMTPDPARDVFTHPPAVSDEIRALVGDYPVDVKQFRTDRKDWLRDEIHAMSRTQFKVVRHFLERGDWNYFQFVDIGLDRIHHGFWQYHDSRHVLYEPDSPYRDVVRDYYLHLDEEIGSLLELLDNETLVLVASDHGAQRLDGGFCVNEWLIEQGWLVLEEYPAGITPFSELRVDWPRTTAWSEGGYYARVFMNVKGREPSGTVDQSEYEMVRDEIKTALEDTRDPSGVTLGTRVFKPEEVYKAVRNVAPDLIAHFGDLRWRSIGGVGYRALHTLENDTGPDGCNHAQFGAMVLASPLGSLRGEIAGAHLLDVAPTLLELAGYDVPSSMQGQSLVGKAKSTATLSPGDETVLRERLSGLGYIS